MSTVRIPKAWSQEAHKLFLNGKVPEAANLALKEANSIPQRLVQAAYYCGSMNAYSHALMLFKSYLKHDPKDIETIKNMGVCYRRLKQYPEAVRCCEQVLAINPDNALALDDMADVLGKLGDMEGARKAGTKALLLKDSEAMRHAPHSTLPTGEDGQKLLLAVNAKKKVCAFSLFGSNSRYLRGALYNVIVGRELFPEWTMRFYVDGTVPHELRDALKGLDAEVLEQEDGQPRGRKLCWRFLVASDPEVGRFMMRDCDSAFSLREALVVDEWLESGELFHVIRDHHAHTDLMLAGLWGGVSGVLSDMQGMLGNFFATARNITSHTDQFFLAEYVWPTIKESCLVHDRIFDAFSPRRPPMKHFRTKNDHIGANRFASDREWQNKCLAPWIRELPCLAVQMTKKG
jgi:hypothetical protein